MWLGFFAWYRGLALGGTVRVSQVQLVQPFLALLFAVPVLGDGRLMLEREAPRDSALLLRGEVQKPGQYPFLPGMSVMTAVSVAGGFTFRANTKTVKITRANMAGSATQTSPVQPGDLIEIRESWF